MHVAVAPRRRCTRRRPRTLRSVAAARRAPLSTSHRPSSRRRGQPGRGSVGARSASRHPPASAVLVPLAMYSRAQVWSHAKTTCRSPSSVAYLARVLATDLRAHTATRHASTGSARHDASRAHDSSTSSTQQHRSSHSSSRHAKPRPPGKSIGADSLGASERAWSESTCGMSTIVNVATSVAVMEWRLLRPSGCSGQTFACMSSCTACRCSRAI